MRKSGETLIRLQTQGKKSLGKYFAKPVLTGCGETADLRTAPIAMNNIMIYTENE